MNTDILPPVNQKKWVEAIAERASCSLKDVQIFIKKYNIVQTPLPGSPKRVNIQRINFSGVKSGHYSDAFEFNFEGMGPGMWGLFTDGNGKGKTTALEIVKWLFKGKVPTTLQAGVKNWIKSASLSFTIDDIIYRISINQQEDSFSGALERSKGNSTFNVINEFNSEQEMEEAVSDFMMDQFELNEIASHRKNSDELDTGTEVIHGWPALASAMFIGTDYAAIFGDVVVAGLSSRILNMYIGLPWIPTYTSLKALNENLKEVEQVEQKKLDVVEQKQRDRLAEIKTELENNKNKKSQLAKPAGSAEQYHKLLQEYNDAYHSGQKMDRELTASQTALGQISQIAKDDEVKLRNFLEDQAANKVFKRINPKCCPHCDRKITTEDLNREQNKNTCSVCDHDMLVADSPDDVIAELQDAMRLSKDAYERQKKETSTKKSTCVHWEQTVIGLQKQINDVKQQLDNDKVLIEQISDLDKLINKLEILEAEYSKSSPIIEKVVSIDLVAETEKAEIVINDKQILKAAIKETESRFQTLQKELFREIEQKMLEYCAKVGLEQYKSLELNGTPSLKIDKDGQPTSYSKVSPGEKLRLKVIALLAIISVGEQKGYGRHPGFLFIDSPAAQEVNDADLQELMTGLNDLCAILPSLQIIVASKATPPLLKLIDEQHRVYAQGSEFLW